MDMAWSHCTHNMCYAVCRHKFCMKIVRDISLMVFIKNFFPHSLIHVNSFAMSLIPIGQFYPEAIYNGSGMIVLMYKSVLH